MPIWISITAQEDGKGQRFYIDDIDFALELTVRVTLILITL